MPLSRFIQENIEAILDEWQQFAASIPSARGLDRRALRDDAMSILRAIVLDMESAQSAEKQTLKAKGRQQRSGAADTAAESHAVARFAEGFDLKEMVSEYRALRASVIRRWLASGTGAEEATLYELTRFNEAIDQALSESVARFSDRIDESRQLFMGVLGHDLRTPLQIILQSALYLRKRNANAGYDSEAVSHIERSAQHLTKMVGDLLDVTRTRLGGSLPVNPQPMDARSLCESVVAEFRALHPERELHLRTEGDLNGSWDTGRLYQLVSNLVRNAIQHGDPAAPVTMTAVGEPNSVTLRVHNFGEPISPSLLPHIFEPLRRGDSRPNAHHGTPSLGLGLYIACTIAIAHGGSLRAESSREHGTVFTACLPRQPHDLAADERPPE